MNKNNSNNNSNEIQDTNNNSNTNIIKNNFEFNFYVLKDIKAKKINKVKGLYEIFHSPEELEMVINKILYKYNQKSKY